MDTDFFSKPRRSKTKDKKIKREESPKSHIPEAKSDEVVRERHVRFAEKAPERYQAQPKEARTYPERTFDKFDKKLVQVRSEDMAVIRGFSDDIQSAKRRLPPELRNPKRITENTIIRLLLKNFAEKLESNQHDLDVSSIRDEDELESFINNL